MQSVPSLDSHLLFLLLRRSLLPLCSSFSSFITSTFSSHGFALVFTSLSFLLLDLSLPPWGNVETKSFTGLEYFCLNSIRRGQTCFSPSGGGIGGVGLGSNSFQLYLDMKWSSGKNSDKKVQTGRLCFCMLRPVNVFLPCLAMHSHLSLHVRWEQLVTFILLLSDLSWLLHCKKINCCFYGKIPAAVVAIISP